MQPELDIFTPYHKLLDMVTDPTDTNLCIDANPDLWFAFCNLTNRLSTEVCVWTQRDIFDWAKMKIRAMQEIEGAK